MRITVAVAFLSLPSMVLAVHLDGSTKYRATGRCFTVVGAVPLDVTPQHFKLRKLRAKGELPLTFDYNMTTGTCTFTLMQPPKTIPAFDGRCYDHPPGNPVPLMFVEDPKARWELLPVVIGDTIGFGGINGYLVFPPGGLLNGQPPVGFSGHFIYTTTYVPPAPAAFPSPWLIGKHGPTFERCTYTGTIRLGNVPTY